MSRLVLPLDGFAARTAPGCPPRALSGEAVGRAVKFIADQPRPCYEMPGEVRQADKREGEAGLPRGAEP
jgi:hypothetical protein